MKHSIFFILAILVLLSFSNVSYAQDLPESQSEVTYETPALATALKQIKTESDVFKADLIAFYEGRKYKPLWFSPATEQNKDISDTHKLIQKSAHKNGLPIERYDIARISEDYADKALERDWRITNTIFKYMHDMTYGRVNLKDYDSLIFMPQEDFDKVKALKGFIKSWKKSAFLKTLEPQHNDYQQLKKSLAVHREYSLNGGWQKISTEKIILYPGESHPLVPEIRARLAHTKINGELSEKILNAQTSVDGKTLRDRLAQATPLPDSAEASDETFFDNKLAQQLAYFQYTQDKKIDAVIGPDTIRALNKPPEHYIEKIILALERWRWLPKDLEQKHIYVNIAGYYLEANLGQKTQFTMPVIVGEPEHQTPVFGSVIKNVKFHPDWIAPSTIAERYLIKKIQKNPTVISRLGYELQHVEGNKVTTVPWEDVTISYLENIDLKRYRFRQKPGKYNALGLARFSVVNNYAIFLHGTPISDLFDRTSRAFSSGCVRVQDPLKLSKFLLNDHAVYDEKKLEDLYKIDKGEDVKTKYLKLTKDTPVYLVYKTAWVDANGQTRFSEDTYGRDEKLSQFY